MLCHELLLPHTVYYTLVWGLLINLLGPKLSIRVLFHPYNYTWTQPILSPSFIFVHKIGGKTSIEILLFTQGSLSGLLAEHF